MIMRKFQAEHASFPTFVDVNEVAVIKPHGDETALVMRGGFTLHLPFSVAHVARVLWDHNGPTYAQMLAEMEQSA